MKALNTELQKLAEQYDIPEDAVLEVAWYLVADGFNKEVTDQDSEFYEMDDISFSQTGIVSHTRSLLSDLDTDALILEVVQENVTEVLAAIQESWGDKLSIAEAYELDKGGFFSEVGRTTGMGVSFWDDYDWEDWGFERMPPISLVAEHIDVSYDFLCLYRDSLE